MESQRLAKAPSSPYYPSPSPEIPLCFRLGSEMSICGLRALTFSCSLCLFLACTLWCCQLGLVDALSEVHNSAAGKMTEGMEYTQVFEIGRSSFRN